MTFGVPALLCSIGCLIHQRGPSPSPSLLSVCQVFWHVTLPNIRWGLLYGIILTNARAMGEFGAVSVISGAAACRYTAGAACCTCAQYLPLTPACLLAFRLYNAGNIIGRTQTLTLFVESAYKEYNSEAAFAAAVLLSCLALATLWVKDKVEAAAAAEAAK
jgi:sulfate/thiosulfate transport system permease protein